MTAHPTLMRLPMPAEPTVEPLTVATVSKTRENNATKETKTPTRYQTGADGTALGLAAETASSTCKPESNAMTETPRPATVAVHPACWSPAATGSSIPRNSATTAIAMPETDVGPFASGKNVETDSSIPGKVAMMET